MRLFEGCIPNAMLCTTTTSKLCGKYRWWMPVFIKFEETYTYIYTFLSSGKVFSGNRNLLIFLIQFYEKEISSLALPTFFPCRMCWLSQRRLLALFWLPKNDSFCSMEIPRTGFRNWRSFCSYRLSKSALLLKSFGALNLDIVEKCSTSWSTFGRKTSFYRSWKCHLYPRSTSFFEKAPRGFNQAELLAKVMGKYINKPVRSILRRKTHHHKQHFRERKTWDNLSGTFRVVCQNINLIQSMWSMMWPQRIQRFGNVIHTPKK